MNRLLSSFCKIFLAPIVKKLLIKEVRGLENVPKTNFILASNHQSHLDEIANGYICVPRRYHFIGQTDKYKGLMKIFLYILYFIAGVIPLDRNSDQSKKKAVKEAARVLRKGDILVIYPEGTRTRTGKIGEGKPGTAKIFFETEIPILPVAIEGTSLLMSPGEKTPKLKKIIRINIGKPLNFKEELIKAGALDKDSKEYKELGETVTKKLMETISLLYSQIKYDN